MTRLRILFHCQHLSGVGHYMRGLALTRELARHHTVWLSDGGRSIPGADPGGGRLLALPRLRRREGRLETLDGRPAAAVWPERARRLAGAVARLAPDVVIVEHYPFSKWGLGAEVTGLLAAARRRNPALLAVCSVRDIPLQTRHEPVPAGDYVREVLARLHQWFDAVMVHADPGLCRLEEAFPAAGRIRLSVGHTGLVPPGPDLAPDAPAGAAGATAGPSPYAVASIGGGRDAAALLARLAAHWPAIRRRAGLDDLPLALFSGLGPPDPALARAVAGQPALSLHPFGPAYSAWLRGAALSISCAGYNTCAQLLQLRRPALLVPNTAMSDQLRRAERLQARGLARLLRPEAFSVAAVADELRALRDAPPADPGVDLDGARGARRFIEGLAGAGGHSDR
ncbi:glycosyltransferase family protein [Alkalilimnicola ehrlichii MLHE-1]|uniref:Putative glycosyltransferase protein n=1 Tax=Alkalilimnicola ehrlichii (strain ATCC BAA-1101 / DSM 17681 / MLHE-1) TaxID=187272 RepID=Q0A639_ALKEH|nr:glycosyltransferase [Alkalilimnicola ehrlichii]ABI57698.1 putative glycosyltransferase protein [Alkalilimnicola ehrlichii MLHE-1]